MPRRRWAALKMDDKSLNLWRQIDACRRRVKKRGLPIAGNRPSRDRAG